MILEFETVNCPICGSKDFVVFADELQDRLQKLPGSFRLVRCLECSLVYQNPRLSIRSLSSFYPENYESFYVKTARGRLSFRKVLAEYGIWRRYRLINSLVKHGKLLDIGCGTGLFLAFMAKMRNWQVLGIEPNDFASRYAREKLGVYVISAFPEQLSFEKNSFDVVTMWDVVEHLPNPVEVLSKVNTWLKQDGVLVIRTPNLRSWDSMIFGEFWAGLDAPRHLFVLDKQTVVRLLEKSGFRVAAIKTGTGSYGIFSLSLRYWLEENVRCSLVRALLVKAWNSLVGMLFSFPAFFILDRIGLGAEMIVIAKPDRGQQ